MLNTIQKQRRHTMAAKFMNEDDYGMVTVVWIVAGSGRIQVMDYETGVGYQSRMTGVRGELGTEA